MFGRFKIDVGTGRLLDTGRHFKGGAQTTNTVQNADPWKGQQPYLTDLFSKAKSWYDSGGMKPYEGQTYAGPTQASQGAQQGELNYATQIAPGQLDQANGAWSRMVNGSLMRADSNPYLQSYMDAATRNLTRNFQTSVLPGISSAAEAQGAYGGARQGVAEGTAAAGLATAVGDTNAQIANNGYNTGLQSMQYALGLTPTMQQVNTTPYVLQDEVGRQQQADQQAALTDQQQRYLEQQQAPVRNLGIYQGIVNGNYGSSTNSTTTGPAMQTGGLRGALGGAMTGGMLASMMGGGAAAGAATAAGGAAAGAAHGSAMGPYGIAAGAILGGLLGAFS